MGMTARGPLYRAVQRVYNRTLRPRLPNRIGVYAGVPARGVSLLDATDTFPNYKPGLMDAIHEHVDKGDSATLIGAGRGVSSVHTARQGATVTAYEAAGQMVDMARETAYISDVNDQIMVRHALVGEGIEIYGGSGEADVIPPANLETGDVLILDCEGAELSILTGITDPLPDTVIVETHPERGVPSSATWEALESHGYDVEQREYNPEERTPRKHVLTGTR